MAAGLLLFVVMLWATSRVVVIPLSIASASIIVWAFFWVRRNPSIPKRAKRVAWSYWLFFAICLLKLIVAAAGGDKGPSTVGKIAGNMFVFSPSVLLIFGWLRWSHIGPPRSWRNYAIACALASASISGLCLYSVISYIQLSHIGYSNQHRLAMAGVYAGSPLAVLSLITATVGEGRARVIVWLAAASITIVWIVAFFYA